MKMRKEDKVYMKPGETNKEDRENFVKFWAKQIRESKDDASWSEQQNIVINGQILEN